MNYCACKTPNIVQRPEGLACATCRKFVATGDEKRDKIRDDIRRIEREIRGLTAQVQELKRQVEA